MSNATVIKENQNQFTLVAGEKRVIPLTLLVSNKDFKTFDITGNTEVSARFADKNSSYFEVTKTGGQIAVDNAIGGKISITLETTDTENLQVGDGQSFDVVVTLPTETRISQIIGRLNVKPRINC